MAFIESKEDGSEANFQVFERLHTASEFAESNTAAGFSVFRVNEEGDAGYYALINYGNPKSKFRSFGCLSLDLLVTSRKKDRQIDSQIDRKTMATVAFKKQFSKFNKTRI